MFDRDFASSIRKYCLFKGEHELNIFNKEEAMSYLVETFSEIRDFDPYLKFMGEAKKIAELATDNAIKADKKNTAAAQSLRNKIIEEEKQIGNFQSERKQKLTDAVNFQTLLEDLEKNKEASKDLVDLNGRLENLKTTKDQIQRSINENYTFRLLDEMWVLMGFEPIAQEYREFVGKLDQEQRRQQSKYDQEVGAKKIVAQMQKELNQGKIPLAINIPDENTMREMLAHPEPVDISLFTSKGEVQHYKNCISLRYDFRAGTRRIKLLSSGQIRQVRDVCIFQINEMEVFL
jgi:DNA sulfur modification protein DndD